MVSEVELRSHGLAPGVPPGVGWEQDWRRAQVSRCLECRHAGLAFKPFVGAGHYVVMAICPLCGRAERW